MIIQSLLALGHYSISLPYLSCDGNWILPITHCTPVCAIHDTYIRGRSGEQKHFSHRTQLWNVMKEKRGAR